MGSGPDGSSLSFLALKQHKFFKGADFQKVLTTDPPLDPDLIVKLRSEKKSFTGFDSPVEPKMELENSIMLTEEEKRKISDTARYNNNEVRTIKEGIIDKKCGWLFYYNRKFILTSEPRLSYYDPKNNEYKVCKIII